MPEISPVDTMWVTITAVLVIFMQAGFMLLEAGFIQAKNVTNVVFKNVIDFFAGSLAYWAVGFGLAFGGTGAFVGTKFFAPNALPNDFGTVAPFAFLLFQFAFAATAATIVSGAMAGRTKIHSYFIYTLFITAFIYPIVSHWVWGGGWLFKLGFLDFAGSTVVHSVGGWSALMGALILGPRIGKKRGQALPAHSLTIAALGTLILLIGWYGFNPGSTLAFSNGAEVLATKVAVNTTLAAGAGAVGAMLLVYLHSRKWDLGFTLNGALAGLVAITAPCAFVDPRSAVLIGTIAAPVVVYGFRILDRAGVDDPVGAVAVHAFNGVWGTLSIGLFHTEFGAVFGNGLGQLGTQAIGVAAVFGWTVLLSGTLFALLKFSPIGLRASREDELTGIDITEHGSWAYDFSDGEEGHAHPRFGLPSLPDIKHAPPKIQEQPESA